MRLNYSLLPSKQFEFKPTSIFSKRPEPELTGLIKRYFLSVQYFEGSALNHNDLRRVQVRKKLP